MNPVARIVSALGSPLNRRAVNAGLAIAAVAGLVGLIIVSVWGVAFALLLALPVAATVSLLVLNRDAIRNFIAAFDWSKNVGAGTAFLIFLVGLVLLNLVVFRFRLELDLTSSGAYTLSGQTRAVLKALPSEVRITFFRSQVPANQQVADLLSQYRKKSGRIQLELVDPDEDPLVSEKNNLQSLPVGDQAVYSTILIGFAGRTEKVDGLSVEFMPDYQGGYQPMVGVEKNLERKITSALVRLQKPPRKIYFTAGHQESDILSAEKSGFSRLKALVGQENYDIDQIWLARTPALPADCAVLVVWGPRQSFEARELDLIADYLRSGGRVLAAVNPGRTAGLNRLFDAWGFDFLDDFVIDKESCYWYQPVMPYVTRFGLHAITDGLNSPAVFPEVCSIGTVARPGVRVRELARSSKQSWGETDFVTRPAEFTAGADLQGPLTMAVAAEKETNGIRTRLVAFGDPDFCDNAFVDVGSDLDLFMNSLNWLAEKEELNAIRPKDSRQSSLMLSPPAFRLVFLLCVVLLPLFFLVFGVVFVARKKR